MRDMNRRADSALNGVESEGWPSPFDLETNEWSSGMNEHRFWAERGAQPRLTYIHYKYANRREGEENQRVNFPFSRSRLILAAAMMLGDALTTNNGPAPEADEKYGMFDELKMGAERRANWLGQPVEAPRALALSSPDLLNGEGVAMNEAFRAKISSADSRIEFLNEGTPVLKAAARDATAESFTIALSGIPLSGPDLVLSFRVKADPMRELTSDVARRVSVKLETPSVAPEAPKELWTWAGGEWFDARFYFRSLTGQSADFTISAEDSGAFYLSDIQAFAHPDALAREFENGLVLANPGLAPYTFPLDKLYPGKPFRRLKGSPAQDPETNNGQTAGAEVEIEPRDGLFLVREKR